MDANQHAQVIQLKDYRPFPYKLKETHLEFFLDAKVTRVIAELHFDGEGYADLELDGEELRLISVAIDGKELAFGDLRHDEGQLEISKDVIPSGPFVLRTEVEINPEANSELSGLYLSGGMFCTQCEAQGFRRITYFPDRPDVMSEFYVKIHSELHVRLSNGNLIKEEKNYSEWHDPWVKPAYLFALVAGELKCVKDKFTTASGRKVDLRIYVRKGDEKRCDYAMDALKRSMRWDEEEYGREYDLDLFMIVAVDDFNMGAMENKGLNIFNSRLVLASPDSATDAQYAAIESVIAHEYFHNWTGNRITCRDWFQLSLKEGLTVYRDQQFSAHERSAGVQRIEDVKSLRSRQFPEDAGPLAHPVRPEAYEAIDNFYTATIYEKGAEVIGMLRTLVGPEDYRKATDLYFERYDGQACTIEDWLQPFIDVTGRDLEQFKLWYSQAGTPRVKASSEWRDGEMHLNLEQFVPDTPGQKNKKPILIPLRYTIYNPNGDALDQGVLELKEQNEHHKFDAPEGAILSLNQGFSAPVHLEYSELNAAFLLQHDQDPFNRWEAGQSLALDVLARGASADEYLSAMGAVIADERLDPSMKALLLQLPSVEDVVADRAGRDELSDPVEISQARKSLMEKVAAAHEAGLKHVYDTMRKADQGTVDPEDAGRRALSGAALTLLGTQKSGVTLAQAHFDDAKLMTQYIQALGVLVRADAAGEALAVFYERFKDNRLVIDNWFSMQSSQTPANRVFEVLRSLSETPDFRDPNPNRFRSLYGGLAMGNVEGFNAASGEGYELLANVIVDYDARNPQIAARIVTAYQSYRNYDEARQEMARAALSRINNHPDLSKNTREMVSRLLG